jgi:hypothetical protein
MVVLDTRVQRRIPVLVYRDLEAAYEFLVRVFGLGRADSTGTKTGASFTGRSEPETAWCGSTRSHRNGASSRHSLWVAPPAWWR